MNRALLVLLGILLAFIGIWCAWRAFDQEPHPAMRNPRIEAPEAIPVLERTVEVTLTSRTESTPRSFQGILVDATTGEAIEGAEVRLLLRNSTGWTATDPPVRSNERGAFDGTWFHDLAGFLLIEAAGTWMPRVGIAQRPVTPEHES
ncbi:MAG: hypothetical protein H6834_05840 [Planctomycetes bacterium]|nr:hypothetical protein [Planctomycetota bacterium]MCB9890914.1 hypothetical protein [Planctomycetota bacterium]